MTTCLRIYDHVLKVTRSSNGENMTMFCRNFPTNGHVLELPQPLLEACIPPYCGVYITRLWRIHDHISRYIRTHSEEYKNMFCIIYDQV